MSASVAQPARAAFGDCSSNAYRGLFDARYTASGESFDCVERLRLPVSTNSGTRHIRIIHEFNADWIVDEAGMREFDRGVQASIDAIGQLGGVDLEDVTVYLSDDFPPPEGADRFSDIAALTDFSNDGECRVIVYLAGPASHAALAASVVTHEIFHCVQVANLTSAQLSTGAIGHGGGGDWWIEGSATWFTALAIPDPVLTRMSVSDFDEHSPTRAINDMSYEAVVFFLWLGEQASPPGLMLFLHGMADSRAASAQHAAMLNAMPQDRWLDFAEAYLDGQIRHPHGADLRFDVAEGAIWQWSATRTETLPLEPFVLQRGVVAFECGHWRTSVAPSTAHSARPEDGGEWSELPAEIDTTSGSGGSYRFAALNATASAVTMNIVGTMESGCGDCAGVSTLDACVVGSWQMTGGGPAEWMRRQGVSGNFSTSGQSVVFRADGSYITGAMRGDMEVDRGDTHGEGHINTQAGGRWSTSGGVLNMCGDSQSRSGQLTVTNPEGSRTIGIGGAPPVDSSERYTCSGGSLNTERDIPGGPPMPFQYSRIGGG